MATRTEVTFEEYQKAKGMALRCAKNVVEDFSGSRETTGTDIEDALASGKELVHQLAIIRRWQKDR